MDAYGNQAEAASNLFCCKSREETSRKHRDCQYTIGKGRQFSATIFQDLTAYGQRQSLQVEVLAALRCIVSTGHIASSISVILLDLVKLKELA